MVLDSEDHLHISFNSAGCAGWAGLFYLNNGPFGIWNEPEHVDSNWSGGQLEGMFTDIAVDDGGNPHISYVSGGGAGREDTYHATRATPAGDDVDHDGVFNVEEQGPDGLNPAYDGDSGGDVDEGGGGFAGRTITGLRDVPPENDTSYNLVKRGDKWPKKDLVRNRSSTSSARLR
jgi:hypothetical protein